MHGTGAMSRFAVYVNRIAIICTGWGKLNGFTELSVSLNNINISICSIEINRDAKN